MGEGEVPSYDDAMAERVRNKLKRAHSPHGNKDEPHSKEAKSSSKLWVSETYNTLYQ